MGAKLEGCPLCFHVFGEVALYSLSIFLRSGPDRTFQLRSDVLFFCVPVGVPRVRSARENVRFLNCVRNARSGLTFRLRSCAI